MFWVAFVAFANVEECDKFVERYQLQEEIIQQCSAWDYDTLAPLTSPRPQAKKEKD
jgi:hypothetical protein